MIWILLLTIVLSVPVVGFDEALPDYRYSFPRDHFAHSNFKTEWWYYTGNLFTDDGRRFGFELTFFRQGVQQTNAGAFAWEIGDVYLAHLALSDVREQQFYKAERLNRSGPGLAGASLEKARIWNGNWEVRWLNPQDPRGRQELRAVTPELDLALTLSPAKPPVVHGVNGVSQKAEGTGRASHYVSFTRLEVAGEVALRGESHTVKGTAWMDHEFFTSSLAPNQAGWDWASIQLDNGTELMVYRLRRMDGTADPYSSGTLVDEQGRAEHLSWGQVIMEPDGSIWESPATGGSYPLRWKIAVPALSLELVCTTPFRAQEVLSERGTSPNYWEGAVDFAGEIGGKPVQGVGYLELTGYDKPVELSGAEGGGE